MHSRLTGRWTVLKFEGILFLLVILSNILISGSFYPIFYALASLLHEGGHILALRLYGHKVKNIKFVGFGIRIDKSCMLSYKQEIAVSLAGPLINTFLFALFGMLYAALGSRLLLEICLANGGYAFLNLFPLPPLDGYKVLKDMAFTVLQERFASDLIKSVNIVVVLMLILIFIIFVRSKYNNFSLYLVIIVLLINTLAERFRN